MCGNEGDPQWVAVKEVFPWNVIKPLFVRSARPLPALGLASPTL